MSCRASLVVPTSARSSSRRLGEALGAPSLHAGRVRACPLALSRLRPLWQTWLWGERLWFEARKTGPKRGMQPGKTPRRDGLLLIKSARRAARADEADDASNHQNGYPIARERRLAERQPPYRPLAAPLARQRSIRSLGPG
jgi:hypothetical protein